MREAGIPNTFAYLMLAIWPVVCMVLFMRMPAPQALLWSVIGGYLLLPSATKFELSGLPDLDKSSMIAIGAGLGTLAFGRRPARIGGGALFYGFGSVFVLSPFVTAFLNPDPIVGNKLYFPGLTWYDGLSSAAYSLFALVPFWAARRLLSDEAGHRRILVVVTLSMLAYSLLVLLEIRLSPQLHRWVYGFFPHQFSQQIRAGGFRAVVFLPHGLVVALFLGLAVVAATALSRRGAYLIGIGCRMLAVYLLIVLVLQKSLGALVLTGVFGGLALFVGVRRQLHIAALVSLVICVYPIVRGAGLLPYDTILTTVGSLSSDRAGSLETRLVNEQKLLDKAAERPLFGWGSWGRNRVYDLEEGRDASVTDGLWVMQIGSLGWVGYVALFGLLSTPLVRLRSQYSRVRDVPIATAAIALLLSFNLCDLIPNASLNPLTWLLAGALSGHVASRSRAGVVAPSDPSGPRDEERTEGALIP